MRHLWNSHAYSLDAEHRFNAIETDYFYFSVLFQTESRVSDLRDSEQYYYKHVAVRPIFSELSLQVLIGKRNNTGGHDYAWATLEEDDDLELRYVDFTDMKTVNV